MFASDLEGLTMLAESLGADLVITPQCPVANDDPSGVADAWSTASTSALDSWRARAASGASASSVIVAVWPNEHAALPLAEMSSGEFARRLEWPFAAWYAALGAASSRCADGGAIVAVIERPPPLDAAGWATESGLADAVEAMVRSLARSEGHRGVRVNAVTTPTRVAPSDPIAPLPSLSTFPGRLDGEVSDAVTMLIGPGISGITGTVVHADCGRSWR
ncbi:MAG: hypothetical protein ABIR32_11055 [Ilumatobacteraceae bacterium]